MGTQFAVVAIVCAHVFPQYRFGHGSTVRNDWGCQPQSSPYKAGRGVNTLARVSQCVVQESKVCILHFVLYFLNYSPVFSLFIRTEDIKNIEKVQYWELKFTFN